MIFEPLRRSLVRWLRPRATSVSPKIEFGSYSVSFGNTVWSPDPALANYADPAIEAVRRHLAGGGKIEDIPGWHDRHIADARPGIKPPPDPAIDRDWCWSEWQRERETFSLPGWTYCRFPIQYPGDRAVFVFGMARGNFGVYHTPIMVHDVERHQDVEQILCCMVHMRTGCGMGLFLHRSIAAQACDLAEKVETCWPEIDPMESETWGEAVHRVRMAWMGVGIVPAVNAFAHRDDGQPWSIYGLTPETMMRGRPERLS